jgi:hypothetical protein
MQRLFPASVTYFTVLANNSGRRKYEKTACMNEQNDPHAVEIALPPDGFRARSMTCWRSTASATFKSVADKDGMTTVNSMCADPAHADTVR